MNATDTIANVRSIRRRAEDFRHGSREAVIRMLRNLERDLAPDTSDAYEDTEIVGFDTVLGYLSKTNPEALAFTYDPTFDTQADGKLLANRARSRGLPILKVAAPAHVRTRFPKVTHVNAYPVHLLAEHFG